MRQTPSDVADLAVDYGRLRGQGNLFMKYKTLFRMLLKVIGVWVFITGAGAFVGQLGYLAFYFTTPSMRGTGQQWYFVWSLLSPCVQMGLGLYLFFGGKWIADKAIPGNRPYCHECGYDLTNAAGNVCTECGTPFRAAES
jgi:hypothetical protein